MDSVSGEGSGTSSPGSRFKVDTSESAPPPAPPPVVNGSQSPEGVVNGSSTPQGEGADLRVAAEKDKVPELLSPGSREGELSVPIIELPDGKITSGDFVK